MGLGSGERNECISEKILDSTLGVEETRIRRMIREEKRREERRGYRREDESH